MLAILRLARLGQTLPRDNDNAYTQNEAEQKQAILDEQNNAYQQAVDTGEIPSAFDVRDKNGNYDLQENIGKNGTYLTEEGSNKISLTRNWLMPMPERRRLRLIARITVNTEILCLSYGASIGAGNGRTA